MNVLLLGAFGEHSEAQMRQDQIDAWRKRRQAELERGEDSQAIMDALEEETEPLEVLWAFIFGANQPETGVEKVRELMRTLITNTLDYEEKRGDWK